ncbi:hypothetical protein MGU_07839 [Metarhizium guizhouense ARSEF 977]|uniref:DUF7779 domain-containing protein n=1 Tax=Metarhizium guizhouense (strain ARSEF 977) TaxID=1276136 RepID=A0A0B4H5L9_METGA|nr:hypothetical protein MGU_07839 [Metarhizium guizhouense ARSEF 977]
MAVAEWAGGLPLIVTAISSTISSRNLTYDTMLDLLKQHGFEAVSADSKPKKHLVQTSLITLIIGLTYLDEHTQCLIYTLSFLNPEGIPQNILMEHSSRTQLEAFPKNHAELNNAQTKLYWFERVFPQESKPFCKLAQSIWETLKYTKPGEKIAEMLRESHNNQGSVANETNNPDYLSRALRIFARRPYHKHEHARTTFRRGQRHLARGKTELAEQSFKAAHKERQSLKPQDTRPRDELLEKDYDELVIFMSR